MNKKRIALGVVFLSAFFMLLLIALRKDTAFAGIKGSGTKDDPYQINTGDLEIDADKGGAYYVTGTTDEHHIKIKGKDKDKVKEIQLHLSGVSIKLKKDDEEEAAITLEGYSNVTIYVDSDTSNTLVGGNEHGAGRNNGHPGIQVDENGKLNLDVWGRLEATGGDGGSDRGAAAIGSRDNDGCCGEINIHVHDAGYLKATGKYGGAGIGGGNNSSTKNINITLDGSAKLEAYGSEGGAGIGGGDDGSTPNINIKGNSARTILIANAENSRGAAGIGGGSDGEVSSVVIDGIGTLTGKGGYKAAGIGAGDHDSTGPGGNFGDLTIKDCGVVEATGGEAGAGIGGSEDADVGNITIENCGEVTATGGSDAAGIGTGRNSNGGKQVDCGDITIKNCKVIAKSTPDEDGDGYGAGIGGGKASNVNSITITAEKDITAIGWGQGAGIGCGDDGKCGNITITNIKGKITATAGNEYGAGIGACDANCGDITLKMEGGTIDATAGYNGAGIGGGDGGDCGSISITGWGTVNATAGFDAAGIGGGEGEDSGSIIISGDSDHSKAHYYDDGAFALKINASAFQEKGSASSYLAPIIGAKKSGAIQIEHADVTVTYPAEAAMYGASIGCGKDGGLTSITIRHAKISQNGGNQNYNYYASTVGEGYGGNVNSIELNDVEYSGRSIGGSAWNGGDIASIKIKNSKVHADAADTTLTMGDPSWKMRYANNISGIGTGCGATMGSIEISGSTIEAYGKNGGAGIGSGGLYSGGTNLDTPFKTGGKCGSITITNSDVYAWSQCGGAGIGGGAMTSVTEGITISGSTIDASVGTTAYWNIGGAGIGGGEIAGCKSISIMNCTVKAQGGPGSAGIGGGGSTQENIVGGILSLGWDPEIGNIDIADSEVTANGGTCGAGIGCGQGCQQTDGCHIFITDCTVTAKGGDCGAGIGGGDDAEFNRGGDIANIKIKGKSRVLACGGKEAAGIGGGSQGELDGCYIDIDESYQSGSVGGQLEPMYYVKAYGGSAGAGIGSGASHCTNSLITQNYGYLAKNITINHGWVDACGGGDMQIVDSMNGEHLQWIGAGAGIGGGAKGGLHGLTINGGVIKSRCKGSNGIPGLKVRQANHIGHGGGDTSFLYRNTDCKDFTITGGTIAGDLCTDVDVKITGGSILQSLGGNNPEETKATNGSNPVFKNTLNLDLEKLNKDPIVFESIWFYPVTVSNVSSSYGTNDIYATGQSDTRAQIGLYLPASAKDAAHATVSGFPDWYYNGSPQYYGMTNKNDNTNILRIGSKIKLEPETEGAIPVADVPFKLLVLPADNYGMPQGVGYTYTASGSSEPEITGQSAEGEAPSVTVTAAKEGDLTVTAKGDGTADDIYWSASEAKYEAKVQPAQVKLQIAKDLNKLYDGKPDVLSVWAAETPDIIVDPEGARGENGRNLDVKYQDVNQPGRTVLQPEDPGDYSVTVVCSNPDSETGLITIDGTNYAPNTVTQNFTIRKYTQEFEVTAPASVVYVKAGEKAEIVPAWTLEVTDKNEDGTPVVPARAYLKGSAIGADKGYVTVKYRNTDDPEQELTSDPPTEPGHYQMVLEACETVHYNAASAVYDFEIAEQADTQLSIEVDDKIYDMEPVSEPKIISNRDPKEISVAYYRVDGGEETPLEGAPEDAGSYKAVATVEETEACSGATAETEFTIEKRQVSLSISAQASGENGAKIRVEVGNGLSDLQGKKISIVANGLAYARVLSLDSQGIPYTEINVDNALPGEYTVEANFNQGNEYGNYKPAKTSVDLKKEAGPFNVKADSMDLVRGGDPKKLNVHVSDYTGAEFVPEDLSISYQISDTSIATIDENGVVIPVNPGICKVDVTVAGDDLHSEGKGSALITVHKSSFIPTIVVESKEYDGQPIEISVEDIPEDYVGLEDHPIMFYYEKRGGEYVKIGDSDYDKVEISDAGEYAVIVDCTRDANYSSAWNYATFRITPKGLNVHTGSAEKVYDGKPLTCEEAEVTGFIEGESAEITAVGSQTEAGSSPNTWQITWAEDDPNQTAKSRNYTVAEEDQDLGTLTVTPPATGPFHIKTYQDLEDMAKNVSENPVVYAGAEYIVDNNIKAPADSSWTLGIGSAKNKIPFTGSLEGNGYCIYGMNINMSAYGGLFEWIGEGGSVSNLYLFDCDFETGSMVGGGIAAVNEGTISNCVNGVNRTTGVYISPVDGSLIPMKEFNSVISGQLIGGIAGINRAGGTIFACRSVAEMTGIGDKGAVGGIAGMNNGSIDNCVGNNTVTASGQAGNTSFGGICGENFGSIAGGYSSASVSGSESAFLGNVAGFGTDGSLADIFYTTSEGQKYQGGGTNKEEQGILGMLRGEMMEDSFVDQLKGTASNKVTWIRDDGINAGLPRIENLSAAFYQKTLTSGNVRLSALLHRGANLQASALNENSDAWKVLAEAVGNRTIESATGLVLTDNAGNIVPSELWSQSDELITVPVSRKNVRFVVLDENGEAKLIDAVKVVPEGDHYLATVKSGGATAFMIAHETKEIESSGVALAKTKVVFNGAYQKPAVIVKDGTNKLKAGTDYTVKYRNNKNAGLASVVVTGTGRYSGTVTKHFAIAKAKNKITKVTTSVKTKAGKTFRIKSKAKGGATRVYQLLTKQAKKYFKVAKNGKVTVKKGVKKGTYRIWVRVTAKATANYKKTAVKKKITIRVK